MILDSMVPKTPLRSRKPGGSIKTARLTTCISMTDVQEKSNRERSVQRSAKGIFVATHPQRALRVTKMRRRLFSCEPFCPCNDCPERFFSSSDLLVDLDFPYQQRFRDPLHLN